jgi:hypothetical protein
MRHKQIVNGVLGRQLELGDNSRSLSLLDTSAGGNEEISRGSSPS